jgi:spermidine/putrescine transport system substrate-binding protein
MRGGELDAVFRNPASRRTFLRGLGVVGASGVLAACRKAVDTNSPGGAASGSPATHVPIDQEPGLIHAYEWAGYDTAWLFKQYTNAGYEKPKFSFLVNTEGALAKTAAGYKWDVTHPEVGYIQDYINLGVLQPWDTSLIPNFADLNPVLEETGQIDGQQYEIVLDWGYSGVIIRSDHVDPSINSYSYLFDDANAGHISWFDTPWIIQQAALVQGVPGDQTFDMTPDQLEAAKNYAIEKGKNVYNIWTDYTQMWDDVRQGNVWAAYAWPDAYVVLKADTPVQYIRPKEGVLSWAEGLVLRGDTEDYNHAHKFADAWASVETGTKLISTWGYGHSNTKIDLNKIDPDVVATFGLDDPETNLSEPNSYFDRYQAQRKAYNRAWEEVKASL